MQKEDTLTVWISTEDKSLFMKKGEISSKKRTYGSIT